jgi:hypothetical protein
VKLHVYSLPLTASQHGASLDAACSLSALGSCCSRQSLRAWRVAQEEL